ncbi:MAG: hypothetical protein KGP14_14090, partial [Betaproteobacteria bacterium]|nr:hypothetical protein [Betaproteobacteria bacterium]
AGVFDCMKNPSPASIEAFAARYARPAELAGIAGSSPRMIVQHLAAANVVPAFGPPRCRQIFYLREEALERLALPRPLMEAL